MTRLDTFRSALAVAAVAALTLPAGLNGRSKVDNFRRGGPHDWSHGRLIATRFGPDLDRNVDRDWRTHLKHVRLDQARALETSPVVTWFDLLQKALGGDREPANTASKLDWNLKTGGFGNVVGSPAKYSFDITASHCSDVIYFTVNQAGSATSPNVIAITNAYAGCSGNTSGTTPTVKWGIRMTSGTATSAVPSLDGTVLYVLESGASSVVLHAINVNNITSNPGTYSFGSTNWSNAHILAAPSGTATSEQLFQLTFSGVVNNVSSPYLDYDSNEIYFGDSSGHIRHVVNVDRTSASVDSTNFANTCGTSQLQSPIFVNDQVIVTSYDGRLYRMDTNSASPYTCIASALGGVGGGGAGALAPPVVDVTNNVVIVGTNNASGFGIAGIGTFDLMFTAGAGFVSAVQTGAATTTAPVSPTFDDAFWSTNSGNAYAVGSPTGGGNTYLVRVPYNGSLGTASGFAQLNHTSTGAIVAASPVTEFLTASSQANKDFLFVGGAGTNYLYMNRIGAGFGGTNASPVSMANSFSVTGGIISGISVDTRTSNITGSTATANIYFGTMGVGTTTQSTIVQLAQQF
ncbi:MAG TPA: hypothetical protein VH583_09875 [Vicinamibacterales bacterium]|jgi:hypothetical protein